MKRSCDILDFVNSISGRMTGELTIRSLCGGCGDVNEMKGSIDGKDGYFGTYIKH